MGKIQDNKMVTFIDLRESGVYSSELLDSIEIGNWQALFDVNIDLRNDRDFMEPLLYAIRNEHGTYIAYKYYGTELQKDTKLGMEIASKEPELIEGTALASNESFVLNSAKVNPKVVKYMDPTLKGDDGFIGELVSNTPQSVTTVLLEEGTCTVEEVISKKPDLKYNIEFIGAAITQNINNFQYASKEVKNDEGFLKAQVLENEKVIGYVIENMDEFGIDGIKGAKEASKEITIKDCMSIINEMAKDSADDRYRIIQEKVRENGEDVCVVRWVTAMVAQKDNVDPKTVKRVLENAIITMEKTRRDLTKDGAMKVNLDNMQQLITPLILRRLIDKAGGQIAPELMEKLEGYETFYKEFERQFREQKEKALEDRKQKPETRTTPNSNTETTLENIGDGEAR